MPFARLLTELLQERKLSLRQFAKLVDRSASGISMIVSGKRRELWPEFAEPWADALGLRGELRERFIAEYLAYRDERLVAYLDKLHAELERRRR